MGAGLLNTEKTNLFLAVLLVCFLSLNVFLRKMLYVLIFLRVKVLKQIFCTLHGNDGENNLVSLIQIITATSRGIFTNIHQYSLLLRRIIVKYKITFC